MKTSKQIATEIVQTLVNAGYTAYFAGGWVRDFILGHPSDDIDIATDASVEEILKLFPVTIHVGIAFGVVIVVMEGHQFEVATFRRDVSYSNGRTPDSIEPTNAEEDAKRRDFTINGMFYDPLQDMIYDFVGGIADIKEKLIRAIGDPYERFEEDKLRMIRAVRFATRFEFELDPTTYHAIEVYSAFLFPAVAIERVWKEFCKMSQYHRFDQALITLHRCKLLGIIFPELEKVHLNSIKHAVQFFHCYPNTTPTILYILQLFPDCTEDKVKHLWEYLKLSHQELKIALTWVKLKHLVASPDKKGWIYFYADPNSVICLEVMAAQLGCEEKLAFIQFHIKQQTEWKNHIERLQTRKPLVHSSHLIDLGVKPGVQMGTLLKEAENITIQHDFNFPEQTLKLLTQSPNWPLPL